LRAATATHKHIFFYLFTRTHGKRLFDSVGPVVAKHRVRIAEKVFDQSLKVKTLAAEAYVLRVWH